MGFSIRKSKFMPSILLKPVLLVAIINQVLCYKASSYSHVLVADIVTDTFFNGFAYHVDESCNEKGFYSRQSFLEALHSYPKFGMVGMKNDSKREIAAFFAHFTHDAIDKCDRVQSNVELHICDRDNNGSPCNPGKPPVWPRTTTQNLGVEGLKRDSNVISFKTALSSWMKKGHFAITSGQGFGATIRAINGPLECDGANPSTVTARVQYYTYYCDQLRVDPGTNLSC